MAVTKRDYVNRVLLIMNEAELLDSSGSFLLGADAARIDKYIEGSFVDAWRRCVKVMPRVWFKNVSFAGREHHANLPEGTGYIVLPDDFYLLTSFKMYEWVKAVYEAYIENDRISSIQSNEYTRGSTIRPVCTVSNRLIDGNMKRALNYYSLPKGLSLHTIEEAIYVPMVSPIQDRAGNEQLDMDDQVLEPLAYLSASTVFTMFEKYDIAKALEQKAVEMFPGLQPVRGNNITI